MTESAPKNRRRSRKPKQPEVYAFIDSQNLNMGTQKTGWKMDWMKFRKFLRDEYNVSHAYMFIGHKPEFEEMYIKMHDLGYLVVLKPTAESTNPEAYQTDEPQSQTPEQAASPAPEKKVVKGNVDAELVLWAMKELPNYDKAIIVSGDGDFLCLVEYLQEKNKLLHIFAPNWQYSSLLKEYEQHIVRLDLLKGKLSHRDKSGRPAKPSATLVQNKPQ